MKKSKYKNAKVPGKGIKKWWIVTLIIGIVTIFIVLELTDTTYIFHKHNISSTIPVTSPTSDKIPSSSPPQTTTTPTNPNTQPSSNSSPSTSTPLDTTQNTSTNSLNSKSTNASNGTVLVAPWGQFVSSHSAVQDSSEQSACNTTPGASCFIQFTQGSNIRVLPTKTADNNGSVIWNWNLGSANITSGSWKITAISTLSGQSKSTSDATTLEVK